MNPNEFYESLNVVNSIRDVLNSSIYKPLPDDWHVAVTDIKGSTDAIRLGKYKEVNMAGACIIAALNNAYGREKKFPFLFGGDGSMMALPDYNVENTKRILAFCKQVVADAYGLHMDIGLIPLREIRQQGHDISVARFRLSEHIDQAVFWGSGVTWAETQVKMKDLMEGVEPLEADFTGLECRWNQVPSRHDEVATYIIQAVGKTDDELAKTYEECFNCIEQLYGGDDEFHPIYEDALKMTGNPRFLKVEWKLRTRGRGIGAKIGFVFQLVFQLLVGLYLMSFKKKTSETDWALYKPDLIKHADYKKFGDGLRIVATGTIQQRMQLVRFLDQKFKKSELAYGVHSSFAAMITCYVKDYQRDHIHFVDGAEGGYAKASQELKVRRAQLGL